MIEALYLELLNGYEVTSSKASELWHELENNYSKRNRHYHNLQHLADLMGQLTPLKSKIEDWNVIMFTLFYHDVIYNATKNDNEEKSAELAQKRMAEIKASPEAIIKCAEQILATKSHLNANNSDTNYFTDADLSILGRDWNTYSNYCRSIRAEYAIYPDFLYNRGRKKVINHFLSMDRIFKTAEFYDMYEEQSRLNLRKELSLI